MSQPLLTNACPPGPAAIATARRCGATSVVPPLSGSIRITPSRPATQRSPDAALAIALGPGQQGASASRVAACPVSASSWMTAGVPPEVSTQTEPAGPGASATGVAASRVVARMCAECASIRETVLVGGLATQTEEPLTATGPGSRSRTTRTTVPVFGSISTSASGGARRSEAAGVRSRRRPRLGPQATARLVTSRQTTATLTATPFWCRKTRRAARVGSVRT